MPSKIPREVSGYTVLPVQLPAQPSFPAAATHYLYLRPHAPKLLDANASRSLFLANLPITATEPHLRHLFATSLSAGRVERIEFQDSSLPSRTTATAVAGKKRKRETVQDFEQLLAESSLPESWDRKLHMSGAHAVVVFIDRPSMEASLKAARRAAKRSDSSITWGGDGAVDEKVPSLGPARYRTHHMLQHPPRRDLLRATNAYMINYTALEEARAREDARRASEPDEDGFVTVTKGPKATNPVRQEEMRELAEQTREKAAKGLGDFYRFQTREKRKERQGELVKKFEEDRRRVEEMRRRRGKIRPE